MVMVNVIQKTQSQTVLQTTQMIVMYVVVVMQTWMIVMYVVVVMRAWMIAVYVLVMEQHVLD